MNFGHWHAFHRAGPISLIALIARSAYMRIDRPKSQRTSTCGVHLFSLVVCCAFSIRHVTFRCCFFSSTNLSPHRCTLFVALLLFARGKKLYKMAFSPQYWHNYTMGDPKMSHKSEVAAEEGLPLNSEHCEPNIQTQASVAFILLC